VYYVWYLVTPTDLVFDLQLTGPLHLVSQCLEHANVIIHYPHWATAIYLWSLHSHIRDEYELPLFPWQS